MISLEDIQIIFNKGTPLEMRALRGVDLAIPKGQFLTVIGSNGAGKSTLLNILAGELIPDSGRVAVEDLDITRWPIYRRSAVIARLFQDPRAGICEHMSIIENIAVASARTSPRKFGFAITGDIRDQAVERLKMLGIGLEKRLGDRVALLSGGQRQALSLIMATFGPAKILLLDEHTAALDPGAADLVMKLTDEIVRRLEITTLMVTHSMRQALDYGNRIVMLHQGRIMLDISGAERASMKAEDLLQLFRRKEGEELADDQLLLD
ncbi:MAG TPA: ABC transporter ATP-binding protein [Pseudolabrys sp.]|jgi:putative ABC transport system ATP-binding protein